MGGQAERAGGARPLCGSNDKCFPPDITSAISIRTGYSHRAGTKQEMEKERGA